MLYISIFVLEKYNIMKNSRTNLLVILAGAVSFIGGLWAYSTMTPLGAFEYGVAGLVLAIVVFSLVVGKKRMKDEKEGLAVDDELSNQIKQKAAAKSFMFSIYLWTMILMYTVDTQVRIEVPIGIGILGMALLFVGFWIYYSKNGIEREN